MALEEDLSFMQRLLRALGFNPEHTDSGGNKAKRKNNDKSSSSKTEKVEESVSAQNKS